MGSVAVGWGVVKAKLAEMEAGQRELRFSRDKMGERMGEYERKLTAYETRAQIEKEERDYRRARTLAEGVKGREPK
jgi:hypothetical protein